MKIESLVFLIATAQGAPRAASKFIEPETWFRGNLTRRSGQHQIEVVNTIETGLAPPGYVNHNTFFAPLLFSVVPPAVPYQTQEVPLHQEPTHLLQFQHSPVNLFAYAHPNHPTAVQQAPRQQSPMSAIPIVVDPVAYNSRYDLGNFEDEVIIKERVLRNLLEGKFRRYKGMWPEAENRNQYSRKRKLYAAPASKSPRSRKSQVAKTSNEEDDEMQGPSPAENLYSPRRERKENPLYSLRGDRLANGNIVVIIPKK